MNSECLIWRNVRNLPNAPRTPSFIVDVPYSSNLNCSNIKTGHQRPTWAGLYRSRAIFVQPQPWQHKVFPFSSAFSKRSKITNILYFLEDQIKCFLKLWFFHNSFKWLIKGFKNQNWVCLLFPVSLNHVLPVLVAWIKAKIKFYKSHVIKMKNIFLPDKNAWHLCLLFCNLTAIAAQPLIAMFLIFFLSSKSTPEKSEIMCQQLSEHKLTGPYLVLIFHSHHEYHGTMVKAEILNLILKSINSCFSCCNMF